MDPGLIVFGLGVGILLDATVVRALLVPALVSLLGRWNWWMPGPFARIARIPSPALEPLSGAPSPTLVEDRRVPVGSPD